MLNNYDKKDLSILTQVVYKEHRAKSDNVDWDQVMAETIELMACIERIWSSEDKRRSSAPPFTEQDIKLTPKQESNIPF